MLSGPGWLRLRGVIMGAVPRLTKRLSPWLEHLPSLSVQIVEDTSARLLSLLDDGRLDLAICRTSISEHPDLYRAVNIREEQLAIVANSQHPLSDAKTPSLAALAALDRTSVG